MGWGEKLWVTFPVLSTIINQSISEKIMLKVWVNLHIYISALSTAPLHTPSGTLVKMTRACSVYGCSNKSTEKTIHGFPKDKKVRRDWVKFVDLKRANFVLTNNSGICQDHFVREDYDCQIEVYKQEHRILDM